MKLGSGNFEDFHCKKRIKVGVNMLNLFKLIKTMNNSETLIFLLMKKM